MLSDYYSPFVRGRRDNGRAQHQSDPIVVVPSMLHAGMIFFM
jgi:hypothetical protein